MMIQQALTVHKEYKDIPIAHRLHRHDGRCQFIHGHNFEFHLEMGCKSLDENGFVVDFGKLKFVKDYLDQYDHGIIISSEDADFIEVLNKYPQFFRATLLDITSVEGMAHHFFYELDTILRRETNDRAFLVSLTVYEDSKNYTTFKP